MLPIYICDDNEVILKKLEAHIKGYVCIHFDYKSHNIFAFSDPYELLRHIPANVSEPAIYFLDIELNSNMNGIELTSKIRSYSPLNYIVFVTAYKNYMPITFERKLSAHSYIVKKSLSDEFISSINNTLDTIFEEHMSLLNNTNVLPKHLKIYSNKNYTYIEENKIIKIETIPESNLISIYLVSDIIKMRYSLNKILEKLDETKFIRCNKYTIVNTRHILNVNVKSKELLLTNNYKTLVSRRKWKDILQIIQD